MEDYCADKSDFRSNQTIDTTSAELCEFWHTLLNLGDIVKKGVQLKFANLNFCFTC
jgi:hypothetical protein